MKKLPLISLEYEEFDWLKDEKTQAAYAALINCGKTIDFSYVVWNDIIDKIAGAMDEAGLAWGADYGNVDETKMSYFDFFTAKRFNAVAYNIERLINNSWKWAVVPDVTGFLGRARVQGYTEAGKNADVVYGWYLIELARVVNLFIDILKNEADFSELIYEESISTNLNDGIRGGEAEKLEYDESVSSSVDGGVRIGDGQQLEIESLSESNSDTEIVAGDGGIIEFDSISKTTESTDMISADGGVMKSALKSLTNQIAIMKACISGLVKADDCEQETTMDAPFKTGDSGIFEHSDIASSVISSEMNTGDAQGTEADGISESNLSAEMIAVVPNYTGAEDISYSNSSLEMISVSPYLAIGQGISESIVSTEIQQIEGLGIETDGASKSNANIGFIGGIAERIKASLISRFNVFAKLSFYTEVLSDWVEQVGSNLYIRQAYSFQSDVEKGYIDTYIWLDPIKTEKDLYIRQVNKFWNEDSAGNVDVDYFLEPIKEGSDLYIRMDFNEEGGD